MLDNEKPQFVTLLKKCLASYGKTLPETGIMATWWDDLKPFPLNVVAVALEDYKTENGEFAPVPAGIAKRCKVMDGRPGAEEAWAIALTSRDESETVVWTQEMAQAFTMCQSVLQMGDEIGARMAFKESYLRLVSTARAAGIPAKWQPSLGWDSQKRTAALTKAATAGLLPAPTVTALSLPSMVNAEPEPSDAAALSGLAKVKEVLATLTPASEKARIAREQKEQEERDALAKAKQEADEKVRAYQQGEAA